MAFEFLTHSARRMVTGSLALVLSCGVAIASASLAHAGSEEPASNMFRKKLTGSNVSLKQNWAGHGVSGGKATTNSRIVNDGSVSPFLALDSTTSMQAVADKYAAIVSAGGWPKVPSGKLKKGSSSKAVGALNKRLLIEGYLRPEAAAGEFTEVYTSATESAVQRFQSNHGLAVTGTIDGPTLSQLNVSAEQRLRTIRANIPRVAEYSKDLGSRYVVVNIPAQQIETVNGGKVYSIHNAIVGRPSRPTPVVMTPLTVIRFNPYWNAPPSIVEKDILPRMLSSSPSSVMASMNMKVFDGVGGPEIDPNKVNWRRVVVDNYHFRQEPGGANAMASAKIEFASPFGIYLHDTPEPHLFGTYQRFYSSGCVRVEKVAVLINWILRGQDGITGARIAGLAETKERLDTPIANPPQLRVAYLTAWPTKDGVAAFRPDIYELDGTGFIMGQPLPVGETSGGQRYVLKPIPRSQAAVDEAEAFSFGALFRRNGNDDKEVVGARNASTAAADDRLITSRQKPATLKFKEKTRTASLTGTRKFTRPGNPDKESASSNWFASKADEPKKTLVKKKVADKKTKVKKALTEAASPKKVAKKDETSAAAKPPETTAKKTVATAKKPKPTTEAAAKCKAGTDGKLPAGCKAPVTAKKPVVKTEKTAAATP